MNNDGTFVTIEGIDGGGKSTVLQQLQERKPEWTYTAEPSPLPTGEYVYESIQNSGDPYTTFFMFMADRANHINEVIRPTVQDGGIVVSDRYADSTFVYQGEALPREYAGAWISEVMEPWNYEPDLTLYLDIDVETALERIDGRGGANDSYEEESNLRAVQDRYERLYDDGERDDVVYIDAEQEPAVVAAQCMQEIIKEVGK